MNNQRRADIAKAKKKFEEIMAALSGHIADLEEVKGQIEDARDEEQEYLDNMPEGLQGSEKGESAQTAIDGLGALIDELGSFIERQENGSNDIDFESYEG